MKKLILFIICFGFGVLGIFNYFIWQPVEETSVPQPVRVTPKKTLDPKALLDNPPKDSIKGTLTAMDGEVKWQSRAATKSAAIAKLQPISQGELIETGDGGTVEVSFNDTITAALFEKSSLDFPQTLPDKFMFVQRSGEIVYTNSDDPALSVRSRALLALLTNGSMRISILEDEPTITIENIEGDIEIAYNDADLVSQVITLKSRETFIFDTEVRSGEVL